MRRTVATYPSAAQGISRTKRRLKPSTTSCRASWTRQDRRSGDAGTGGDGLRVAQSAELVADLSCGQHEAGLRVVDGRTEDHAEYLALSVDHRATRITLSHSPSDRVNLAVDALRLVDVGTLQFDGLAHTGGGGLEVAATGVAEHQCVCAGLRGGLGEPQR